MAHTGTTRYVDARVPLPSFALSNPDADQLERIVALGQIPRVHLFSGAAYVTGAHSQNVVADVKGTTRAKEVVLLAAHLDSWDQGTGAIDDGAGTAIIVAAAKLMRDLPHRPQRTVRVVLFGSEEIAQPNAPFGDFGGNSYAANHLSELPGHVLAGESDLGSDRIFSLALPASVFHGRVPAGDRPGAEPARRAAGGAPGGGRRRGRRSGGQGGGAAVLAQPGCDALLRHAPHRR